MTDKAKRISANKRKGKSVGAALLNIPYMVWAMIFIIVPMFIVAFYAFTDADGAFTLENFKQLGEYRDNIADSFIYAFIATVITLLLAYPFAYFVTKCKESTQKIIMMLVMVPLWMNLLILTYSIMNIIEANGIINNFGVGGEGGFFKRKKRGLCHKHIALSDSTVLIYLCVTE